MCRCVGMGALRPPILSNLQEGWSKFSHIEGGLAKYSRDLYFLCTETLSIGGGPLTN